jgi:hypothetical protein
MVSEPGRKFSRYNYKESKASFFYGNILNKTMIFTKFVGLKISNKKLQYNVRKIKNLLHTY